MSEDVARAVGAGDPEVLEIAGKRCKVRALSIKELSELERDCLKRYKRQFLETFAENADLIVNGQQLVERKMMEAAAWDVSDLPTKYVYDPEVIKTNKKLDTWLKEHLDYSSAGNKGTEKVQKQRLVASALESGALNDALYENLIGDAPRKVKVGYVSWWLTGTNEGMISMVWMCFGGNEDGLTRDEVAREIGKDPKLLVHLSREIEKLSGPEQGNG